MRHCREVRVEAVWLRSLGLSFREVGVRVGVSAPTVMRWCRVDVVQRPHRPSSVELDSRQREQILLGVAGGESNAVIAAQIGVARSTVWREITRNGGRETYSPHAAAVRAAAQAARPRCRWWVQRPWLWKRVKALLFEWWSPEQIAAWLRVEFPDSPRWWVSHESIYQAVYLQAKGQLKAELVACLRRQQPKRQPQGRSVKGGGAAISGMVNISERPAEVEDRAIPGHWEGDLIIGKGNGSQVATLVERTTRYGMLIKLDSKEASHVAERIAAEVIRLPAELLKTLTWDQGTELAAHAQFTIDTGIPIYFCNPHSPWERGTNENWNGLVRQGLPKGTDLSKHTQADLDALARLLNGRPRKTLGWRKPAEAFNELIVAHTT